MSGANNATSWAQAAGKGLPQNAVNASPGGAANAQNAGSGGGGAVGGGPSTPGNAAPVAPGNPAAAGQPGANNPPQGGGAGTGDSNQQKRELEKLREALFATDGWGGVSSYILPRSELESDLFRHQNVCSRFFLPPESREPRLRLVRSSVPTEESDQ